MIEIFLVNLFPILEVFVKHTQENRLYYVMFGVCFLIIISAWQALTSLDMSSSFDKKSFISSTYVDKYYVPNNTKVFITRLDSGRGQLVLCNLFTKDLAQQMSRLEKLNPDQRFFSRRKLDSKRFSDCLVVADQIIIHRRAEEGGSPITQYLESAIIQN
jgi:hypothetical protein